MAYGHQTTQLLLLVPHNFSRGRAILVTHEGQVITSVKLKGNISKIDEWTKNGELK
jgi:hypothetical protein